MLGWRSNDFSFKLNYQSIRPADQNTGCKLTVWTCCVVESLYKLTAAHIGGNIYLYMAALCCLHGGLLGVNRRCDNWRGSCKVFMLHWVVNEHAFGEEDLWNQRISLLKATTDLTKITGRKM